MIVMNRLYIKIFEQVKLRCPKCHQLGKVDSEGLSSDEKSCVWHCSCPKCIDTNGWLQHWNVFAKYSYINQTDFDGNPIGN